MDPAHQSLTQDSLKQMKDSFRLLQALEEMRLKYSKDALMGVLQHFSYVSPSHSLPVCCSMLCPILSKTRNKSLKKQELFSSKSTKIKLECVLGSALRYCVQAALCPLSISPFTKWNKRLYSTKKKMEKKESCPTLSLFFM